MPTHLLTPHPTTGRIETLELAAAVTAGLVGAQVRETGGSAPLSVPDALATKLDKSAMPAILRKRDPTFFAAEYPGASHQQRFLNAYQAAQNAGGGKIVQEAGVVNYDTSLLLNGASPVSLSGYSRAGTLVYFHSATDYGYKIIGGVGFSADHFTAVPANDTNSGALMMLQGCGGFFLGADLCLQGAFGQLDLVGAAGGIVMCYLASGYIWNSRRPGSYLCRIRKGSTGIVPAEIFFLGNNWRENTGSGYLDYSVLIQCCDGIWLVSPHYGITGQAGIAVIPEDNLSQITAINASQVYSDKTRVCILFEDRPGGAYAGQFGAHVIELAQAGAPSQDGALIDLATTGSVSPSSLHIKQAINVGRHAIYRKRGDHWKFDLDGVYNLAGDGLRIEGGGGHLSSDRIEVRKTAGDPTTPTAAVRISGTVSDIDITAVADIGTSGGVINTSTGTNIRIGPVHTDKTGVPFAPAAFASVSASQTITDLATVAFNAPFSDPRGLMVGGKFRAPVSGWYDVRAAIAHSTGTVGDAFDISIVKTGASSQTVVDRYVMAAAFGTAKISDHIWMAPGDTVEVKIVQRGATGPFKTLADGGYTRLSVSLAH